MRTLILGDTHSYWPRIIPELENAIKIFQINSIIQVGDLCYLPKKYYDEESLLNQQMIIDFINEKEIPFYWIDGNHEDHSILQSVTDFNNSEFNVYGKNFIYQPRGSYLELDRYVLFFIGGAETRDWHNRTEGIDFFRNEVVTRDQEDFIFDQIEKIKTIKKPVIVIAHTCPYEAMRDDRNLMDLMSLENSNVPSGHSQNHFLDEVVKRIHPRIFCHGHFHRERTYMLPGYDTVFISLGGYVQKKYQMNDKKFFIIDL